LDGGGQRRPLKEKKVERRNEKNDSKASEVNQRRKRVSGEGPRVTWIRQKNGGDRRRILILGGGEIFLKKKGVVRGKGEFRFLQT